MAMKSKYKVISDKKINFEAYSETQSAQYSIDGDNLTLESDDGLLIKATKVENLKNTDSIDFIIGKWSAISLTDMNGNDKLNKDTFSYDFKKDGKMIKIKNSEQTVFDYNFIGDTYLELIYDEPDIPEDDIVVLSYSIDKKILILSDDVQIMKLEKVN